MINFEFPSFSKKVNFFFTASLLTSIVFPSYIDASWFGKYKSRREALEACYKWKNEETKFSKAAEYEVYNRHFDTYRKYKNRYCRGEEVTRQFLGIERKGIKDGWSYGEREIESFEEKIKKHIRY